MYLLVKDHSFIITENYEIFPNLRHIFEFFLRNIEANIQ